jgi:hypothetical protein
MKKLYNVNTRLAKWVFELSQYTFKVYYKPGKDNEEADCLSRNPVDYFGLENPNKIINLLHKNTIISHQKEFLDPINKPKIINEELLIEKQKELKKDLKKTRIQDEIIIKLKKNRKLVYIPNSLEKILLDKFHTEFGHIGTKQMTILISKNYYFKNLNTKVKEMVDSCEICAKNKSRLQKSFGKLSQLGPVTRPYELIAFDTVGGLAGFNSNKPYLHIAIDAFTKSRRLY